MNTDRKTMYALKLELKLNNVERSRLAGCAGFYRFVYNFGLSLLKDSWSFSDVLTDDKKRLAAIEKIFISHLKTNPNYTWISKYPSAIYSQAFRNLASSINRFRKGISGFSRMKSKKHGDSFTVLKKSGIYDKPVSDGGKLLAFTNRQVLKPGKRITIPGLGEFRLKQPIPFLCSSQTFTISRTADKWFVSFTLLSEKIPTLIHEIESVGIDLGVKCFATLSDGQVIEAPSNLKKAKTKLSKEQWRNRHKQLGNRREGIKTSKNAKKYLIHLAKKHAHISNIRKDFLQKTTTVISRNYYIIRIEDLNVSGMIANHKLSEAISNLGFYEFRRMLTYKSAFYGTKIELVDRWYPSSKTCSSCGQIQPMPLHERVYRCGSCGNTSDRDKNAAINLEKAPNQKVRARSAEFTPADRSGAVSPERNRKQTSNALVSEL